MIDLVLTHLNQPWGPPWTLATLGRQAENLRSNALLELELEHCEGAIYH